MELVRCLAGTGTLVVVALAGALGAARPPVLAAADPPWQPPPCGEARAGRAATEAAWYRLDALLDGTGTLAGQRLTVGTIGGGTRHLDLAAESFASGPEAGVILVGEDDGHRSELRLLDAVRGCETAVALEADAVVRGAILAPDGMSVWEHHVNRATREDEGVWSRGLAGGPAVRVLPGLPVDGRFGPTFVTDLSWTADGRLGVASCAARACRTRVLDIATGRIAAFEATGPLVGVVGDLAVVHGACAGLPCPLEGVDLASGRRSVLVPDAGLAALDRAGSGTLLFEAEGGSLEVLDLGSGRRSRVGADAGLLPVTRTSSSRSGADVPRGSVVVAPGGRIDQPAASRRVDIAGRTTTRLEEVLP